MSKSIPSYNYQLNDSVNNLDQLSAEYARLGNSFKPVDRNDYKITTTSGRFKAASPYAAAGATLGSSLGSGYGNFVSDLAGKIGSVYAGEGSVPTPNTGGFFSTVGGIIGTGVGLLYGLGQVDKNEQSNIDMADAANILNRGAYEEQLKRIDATGDILQDRLYRQSAAHVAAEGGEIERKQMSLKDFSDLVLKKKPVNAYAENSRVVRTYCKGGVKISFK